VEATVEVRSELQHQLEEALEKRDIAQQRFQAMIGTSAEMGAYQRLRRASRRVSAADAAARTNAADEVALHA
jgi:hypothetical protein